MNQWYAVQVTVAADAVEAAEHAFNLLGSIGNHIKDFKKADSETVCVVGYFEQPLDKPAVESVLTDAFETYQLKNVAVPITFEKIPETDWLAEWKKHWQPTAIGRFVIAPPWSDVGEVDGIVIRIEPNMAFGTGTHATTQLCLKVIGESFHDGMSMLDVGTGTGILAIAVAKLSLSSHIVACDVDADSVKIARENAAENGVPSRIEFYEGSIDHSTPAYDFIVANLTLDVITPILPMLVDKARKILLLSGILVEQEGAIRTELLKLGISNSKFSYSGEWLSVFVDKCV